MELKEIEAEVARLDALFAPTAHTRVDTSVPDWQERLAAEFATPLADQLGVRDRVDALLHTIIERYATGDEPTRTAIRGLFDRYTSFRWAAHLPREWTGAAEFRARLLHLSACDQGADTRDEILNLQALCVEAREAGIDIAPILAEVAALSSTVDRYGMGSMMDVITQYSGGSGSGQRKGRPPTRRRRPGKPTT